MEQMKAGFSRVKITPWLGAEISGYYERRFADAVLDELYIHGVCFEARGKKGILLVCDTCGCYSDDNATLWQKTASEELGGPEECAFICHTHTHTGPQFDSGRIKGDPKYIQFFTDCIRQATREALADLKPVKEVRGHEDVTYGMTFVRRVKKKDGRYQTWAKNPDPDIECMASEADQTMRLVRIIREDAPEIDLVNFQCHPDMIGGSALSSDFPGAFRREFRKDFPENLPVFINGAEGQMTFYDYMHGTTGKTKSYARALKFGRDIADYAKEFMKVAKPIEGPITVSFDKGIAHCATKRDASRIPEALRLIELHEAGKDTEINPSRGIVLGLVAEAYNLRELEQKQLDFVDLPVYVLTVGGLAFAGIPGEPFCEIGQIIRERSPFPMTMVACQTFRSYGYYPDAIAFDQDGYEPRNSRLSKGVGEKLEDAAISMLGTLYEAGGKDQ